MALLNLQSFAVMVENQAAAIQARASQLLDFTKGSILRALIEANAAVGLWLESLVVYTLSLTRASTSQGTDLDSWVNDYGLTRLGATLAQGNVTFSRYSSTVSALIPIGTTVTTLDGTQTFTVSVDSSNPDYAATMNGYLLPIGMAQLTVPVVATIPGPGANVAANTVGLITSSTPGIDTVNNGVAFAGGTLAETDAQLRARFVLYIASLSKATVGALGYAITSLELGLQYAIHENVNLDGTPHNGMVTIIVDDGSGATPTPVVNAAATSANAYRAGSVSVGVYAAVTITANVSMNISVGFGYSTVDVEGAISAALTTYIQNLGLEKTLTIAGLYATALAVPGVTNVNSVLINSSQGDLNPGMGLTVKPGVISVGLI